MRIFSVIILLSAFVTGQFAKQVSYLECRLSNTFKTEREKCDCERLLNQQSTAKNNIPSPVYHNHFHLDDLYDTISIVPGNNNRCILLHFPATYPLIKECRADGIDRPPQVR